MSESKLREAVCIQVAKLVREKRIEQGLSMTELADRAGLSRAMISFVERDIRNPTLETLLRISSVLKVELADLIREATSRAKTKIR
jgi:XRE family transcriptional regulator of biofilm formation